MAIRCLEIVLKRLRGPIYVFHEIVHNRRVVKHFQHEGAIFVEDVSEVPRGATLVFSAHGVSPTIRDQARRRHLKTIDATCPLVAKVHTEAIRFAQRGYEIVLIGHAGHDEVVGTLGEVPQHIHLVETEADVDKLLVSRQAPLAYLTQTTLSVDETRRIVERLRQRYPHVEAPPKEDICYATQNRQQAVHQLSQQVDVMVVIGSQNSSNSRRLCEVARQYRVPAYLVDGPDQLEVEWFSPAQTVGVTAGASAPESAVQEVVSWLQSHFVSEVEPFGEDEAAREFPLPTEVSQLSAATW